MNEKNEVLLSALLNKQNKVTFEELYNNRGNSRLSEPKVSI